MFTCQAQVPTLTMVMLARGSSTIIVLWIRQVQWSHYVHVAQSITIRRLKVTFGNEKGWSACTDALTPSATCLRLRGCECSTAQTGLFSVPDLVLEEMRRLTAESSVKYSRLCELFAESQLNVPSCAERCFLSRSFGSEEEGWLLRHSRCECCP